MKSIVLILLLVVATFSNVAAAADPTLQSRPLTGETLLAVPAALADRAGKEFTVAKVPPTIDLCLITGLPDKGKQTLWSSWGDGCLASNGKYYTSIGDHLGVDSTSHVYEYDPATKELRLVVDVFRDLKIKPGVYGHGKIHSGIHEASDGWLYFATYWGKHREIEEHFGKDFEGSVLLRYHPAKATLETLGPIVPRQGLPASHFDRQRGLLYFYAVYKGDICVYDTAKQQRIFLAGGDIVAGNRTFMGDAAGRVYFTGQDDRLHFYDPGTNKLAATTAKLPGGGGESKKGDTLRAAAQRPTKSGLLYGMTATGQLFGFDPKAQAVRDLGPNFAGGHYTAVMAISPDDRFLYFIPGAHGSSGSVGTPVVQCEIATGRRKVLAFLHDALVKELQYSCGGTYNLQIDGQGERLFVTFNGSPFVAGKKAVGFGLPSVMVVHVPKAERE